MSSRLADIYSVSSVNSSKLLPRITQQAEWLPSYPGDSVRGVESQSYLFIFFPVTPSFKPPLATFDFEESLGATVGPVGNTAKAKKGKKTKKGYVF